MINTADVCNIIFNFVNSILFSKLTHYTNNLTKRMQLFNYIFLTCCSISTILGQSNPKNVLLFIIDDLRPEFGPYLDMDDAFYPLISTPNMNALAGESMVMRRAYTQYALCGPSRTSFLTGRRPDTTEIYVSKL